MISQNLLFSAAFVCASACAFAETDSRERPALPPPNMIVILADDLGYGDLGCTGSTQAETPHIDRLAREGVFCSRAYVTAPMSAPSRMGLLTGRFPKRYGITTNPNVKADYLPESHYGLPLSEKLLPEYLKPFGYVSAVFGKWHLGHTPGFTPPERGFDRWWGFLGGSRSYFPEKKETGGLNPSRIESNFTDDTGVSYLTDDITERAVSFLRENGAAGTPFFMLVSYNAPHWPLQAKPEDIARFRGVEPRDRRIYCAMIYAMDKGVGRILDALEASGAAENTIVVFLSDNGGAPEAPACNAPFRGAKRQHFSGGVRVPFIVRWPADARFAPGSVCARPVSSADLLPTLLRANGADVPENLDGKDLAETLGSAGVPAAPRTFFWCTDYTAAVMRGDLKYLLVPDRAPQLYDVGNDPRERRDLYLSRRGEADALARELGAYLCSTPACRFPDSPAWSLKLLREYDAASAPAEQPPAGTPASRGR